MPYFPGAQEQAALVAWPGTARQHKNTPVSLGAVHFGQANAQECVGKLGIRNGCTLFLVILFLLSIIH